MYQRIKFKILQLLSNPNARIAIFIILALMAALIGIGNDQGSG